MPPRDGAHDRARPQAGRELIAAANEAGGRDNITVILFRARGGRRRRRRRRRGPDGGAARRRPGDRQYDTFEGEAVPGPRQGASRPYAHTRVRDEEAMHAGDVAHAVRAGDETEAEYRASGTVALSAIQPRAPSPSPRSRAEAHRAAPRRSTARRRCEGGQEAPLQDPRRRRGRRGPARDGPGRLLARDPGGLLRRHRRRPRRHGHDLPRPARRPPARHRALHALPGLRRHARSPSPPRGARRSRITSCARRTTRRTS